ncbi:MAG: CDGSH iron-sulfur domain-containing protein [Myxococcales bacterium]|nr:CDGSH iron-sulfur domain-containing protein [Myxococcales bacterium]
MADSKSVHTFSGAHVDVTWDSRLCIHVGECGRAEGGLFVGGRKPWCQPDLVSADEVAQVVERCPTGALAYTRKDGGPAEAAPARNTVTVANNGPLYVTGDLRVAGAADDMPGTRTRVALCRCGQSANKPFCDGRHEKVGFVDRGAIGSVGKGVEGDGGVLEIKRAKNGPLLLSGNVEIRAGSGRVAWRGTKAALCRCGQSGNKPFCDGSHAGAGFEAE